MSSSYVPRILPISTIRALNVLKINRFRYLESLQQIFGSSQTSLLSSQTCLHTPPRKCMYYKCQGPWQGTVRKCMPSNSLDFLSTYFHKTNATGTRDFHTSMYSRSESKVRKDSEPDEAPNDQSRNDESRGLEQEQIASQKPLTQRQKLAKVFAEYGTTGLVVHTCISLTSLGICYMIVSSGIDMVALFEKLGLSGEGMQGRLTSGASTFVVAYACHKVFMPLRIFLTVTFTPVVVNRLRAIGFLRHSPIRK